MFRVITATALFLFFFMQCAKAQVLDSPISSSTQKFKWEIGADMLWLLREKPDKSLFEIWSSNVEPFTIMLRVHQKEGSTYRVKAGAHYRGLLNSSTVTSHSSSGKIQLATRSELDLLLGIGKEWGKQYNKFRLFYGSDVFLGYRSYHTTKNEHGQEFEGRKTSVGVSPLIGVQYFVLPRLSISVEAHLDLAYIRDRTIMYVDGEVVISNIPSDYGFLKAEFQPLSVINLNYHF